MGHVTLCHICTLNSVYKTGLSRYQAKFVKTHVSWIKSSYIGEYFIAVSILLLLLLNYQNQLVNKSPLLLTRGVVEGGPMLNDFTDAAREKLWLI